MERPRLKANFAAEIVDGARVFLLAENRHLLEALRDALLARGLKGAALENAEQEFRASALAHAQTALQHAYALDRLGAILRRNGEASLNPEARIKWALMVERHSTAAVTALQILRLQLVDRLVVHGQVRAL